MELPYKVTFFIGSVQQQAADHFGMMLEQLAVLAQDGFRFFARFWPGGSIFLFSFRLQELPALHAPILSHHTFIFLPVLLLLIQSKSKISTKSINYLLMVNIYGNILMYNCPCVCHFCNYENTHW